jgi:twitching motility protein PilT
MQLNQQETLMTTQTQELLKMLQQKIISKENAIKNSNRPDELIKLINAL